MSGQCQANVGPMSGITRLMVADHWVSDLSHIVMADLALLCNKIEYKLNIF